jgi:hypothetical protein
MLVECKKLDEWKWRWRLLGAGVEMVLLFEAGVLKPFWVFITTT